ncbi:MAG: YfhO family protein [Lachnospiraceae bacterium]|nr:YfhO family protein [Lachnospiraceae bacterium]
MNRQKFKQTIPYLILGMATLFFCWFFCGRYGVFGSKVDWISQHSVLPDYFRQQFYNTGQLFPEFAANIGGGQNIYNFAYYGLYSPVVLISYFLPFVKMSDYMMAAGVISLLAAVLLFYKWFLRRGITSRLSFLTALLFLLSGPMIYHSYNQIMFVNYMPFLCLAFLGVDRCFEKQKAGLYTISVFLMILTSFYFSIGGMFALVLYVIYRYTEGKEKLGENIKILGFVSDGFRFLLPMLTAVLMSAVLLVPTAMALAGGREGGHKMELSALLIPEIPIFRVVYTPYGIGLTTLAITVLITGLTYRKLYEKFLHIACIAILTVPLFAYLLNGGLYIRDKVMIPFLPLLCYLIATYLEKQKRREISFWAGVLPFLLTIVLVYMGREQGKYSEYLGWVLMDALAMLVCYLIFYWKKFDWVLIVVPIGFLALYGVVLHKSADKMIEPAFYEEVTNKQIRTEMEELTEKENGFYRMEQSGTTSENATNLNRIWNMQQYVSSIYSSSYNAAYQKFRTETLLVEQPFRNVLMQSVTENPIYQKLMGVKYILSKQEITGYQQEKKVGDVTVYKNEEVLPIAYVTNQMISEKAYEDLAFPYSQLAFLRFAVGKSVNDTVNPKEVLHSQAKETGAEIPMEDTQAIEKVEDGYHIKSKKIQNVKLKISEEAQKEEILFVQFELKNYKRSKDVSVWLAGVKNKLSARTHIYYNGNTTFTYAVNLKAGQTEVNLGLGEGNYEIRNLRCYIGNTDESLKTLCQSEFRVDKAQTKGDRIVGSVDGVKDGYLITSIPYDEHFEVKIDGKDVKYEKVNTAFLGVKMPDGTHEVEIVYHAPGLKMGKVLSVTGLLLLAGMMLWNKKKACKPLDKYRFMG